LACVFILWLARQRKEKKGTATTIRRIRYYQWHQCPKGIFRALIHIPSSFHFLSLYLFPSLSPSWILFCIGCKKYHYTFNLIYPLYINDYNTLTHIYIYLREKQKKIVKISFFVFPRGLEYLFERRDRKWAVVVEEKVEDQEEQWGSI